MAAAPSGNPEQQHHTASAVATNYAKDEIGWLFVQEYYTHLYKNPGKMHLFYKKQSVLVYGDEGSLCEPRHGQAEIKELFDQQNFNNCNVCVSNVDAQECGPDGILIQVLGELCNNRQESQKFAQTFFLSEQTSLAAGYYVRNSFFRFLKEEPQYNVKEAKDYNNHPAPYTPLTQPNGVEVHSSPEHVENTSMPTPAPEEQVQQDKSLTNGDSNMPAAKTEETASVEEVKEVQPEAETAKASESVVTEEANHTTEEVEQTQQTSSKPFSWASLASKDIPAKAPVNATSVKSQHAPTQSEKPKSAKSPDSKAHSVFVKNVYPRVTDDQVKEALGKFGKFTNFDINRPKNCAFADYSDLASFKNALESSPVKFGSDIVLFIEERRRGFKGDKRPHHGQREARKSEDTSGQHQHKNKRQGGSAKKAKE